MMDGHAHTHCQGDPQLYVVGKNLTCKPPLVGPWVLNASDSSDGVRSARMGKQGVRSAKMNLPLKTAARRTNEVSVSHPGAARRMQITADLRQSF